MRTPDGRAIERALRRAGREALRGHKRRGESIVVWKDGRVVTLTADEIQAIVTQRRAELLAAVESMQRDQRWGVCPAR